MPGKTTEDNKKVYGLHVMIQCCNHIQTDNLTIILISTKYFLGSVMA